MTNRILLLGLLALLPARRSYADTLYSDQASFLNQVAPGYYLETFDGLNGLKNLGNDLYFSSNGFSYWAHAFGGYSYGNGQFYGGYLNYGDDLVLMASEQGTTFTFDFLNGGVTAVGGTFFLQDDNQDVTTGTMHVTLQDGTQVTINGDTPFSGFTSPTPITEITVDSNRLSAVDNLYVGNYVGASSTSAVPEPSYLIVLACGLLVAGFVNQRRVKRTVKRKRT
jgi:hypothetical protein